MNLLLFIVLVCLMTTAVLVEAVDPTSLPTSHPTPHPTPNPTATPTATPSETPSETPTAAPTAVPTVDPTASPSAAPTTASPSHIPTRTPTRTPTTTPQPTVRPTVAPTASPTAIPIKYSKSSLVLGIGAGTLTIIVLAVALAFVFCLSEGCERNEKSGSRIGASLVFAVVFLALVLAPRENEFEDQTTTVTDANSDLYDSHVTTRIAIAIVTCFFAAIASCALCFDLRDHHTLSNMTYDERAFWQD